MLSFFSKDMPEGLQAVKEKRDPVFPSTLD
jgi:hypothetical protein